MILPSEADISAEVIRLFTKVENNYHQEFLSALVPIDRTHKPRETSITYVPDWEMKELCEFVNDFKTLHDNPDFNQSLKTRIEIMIYCHIMEADFLFIVLWNLLRILNGQQCEWTFSGMTKKGGKFVCQYPRQKIAEIQGLSLQTGMAIGEVIGKFWRGDLRNAFSHSQYCLCGNYIINTKDLSPLSREETMPVNKGVSYSPQEIENLSLQEIEALYLCTYNFLVTFIKTYNFFISPYKDGNPHRIQSGLIKWWDHRGTWIWP